MSENDNVRKLGVAGAIGAALGGAGWWIFRGRRAHVAPAGGDLGERYVYGGQLIPPTDPSLVDHHEQTPLQVPLERPRAIAAALERHVLVGGDQSLLLLSLDSGEVMGRVELSAGPRALATDEEGRIYIALADRVRVFTPGGEELARWEPLGDRAMLTSIAVDGPDVYLGDAGRRVVVRCDRQGAVVNEIGRRDEERNIPGIVVRSPCLDVAAYPDGLVRVANSGRHSVEAYTPDGHLELSWGRASMTEIDGFVGCCGPQHIAVTPEGDIITSEKGSPRVKRYAGDGTLRSVVAATESFNRGTEGLDLSVAGDGRILVLDPARRQVRIFQRGGSVGEGGEA